MGLKAFLLIVLAILLVITSEVAARKLVQRSITSLEKGLPGLGGGGLPGIGGGELPGLGGLSGGGGLPGLGGLSGGGGLPGVGEIAGALSGIGGVLPGVGGSSDQRRIKSKN
ncbi:hypothetical protein AABB24_036478 [Solanum stoloniferum]|uniref:Glycine-rich protein n=1 Tax=Solanum stoloniferum TaxID=62892 RepID=A0ABD2RDG1_9SOLN